MFPFNPSKTLYIAIDVQERFCRHLAAERRLAFPKQVRRVADALFVKAGIETLWVACGDVHPDDKMLKDFAHEEFEQSTYPYVTARLGLPDIRAHETVLVKFYMDAFQEDQCYWFNKKHALSTLSGAGNGLNDWLKAAGYETILIGGISTGQCVAATLSSAVRLGFNAAVFINGLADMSRSQKEHIGSKGDDGHHYNILALSVANDDTLDNVPMIDTADFIKKLPRQMSLRTLNA